jgi:hypothetical protein
LTSWIRNRIRIGPRDPIKSPSIHNTAKITYSFRETFARISVAAATVPYRTVPYVPGKAGLLSRGVRFRRGIGHVDRHALHYVVLAAQRLRNLNTQSGVSFMSMEHRYTSVHELAQDSFGWSPKSILRTVFRIRTRKFLGLPDPDSLVERYLRIRIQILPFSRKGVERSEIMLEKLQHFSY